ncbi:MAG TPA: hypothetical protein VKG63_05625 [Steroidobacteraceae bacterium]|nr:hypothetical protein [Steroidobacteraceae bacterium]
MIHRHQRGDDPARASAGVMLLLGALLALPACRAPAPRATAPDRAAPDPQTHEPVDGSYDWHGLLIAPFGSVLKDIPVSLHEVLLFRDEAHGGAAGEDAECYAANAPAPRFVGRMPDEYLLCFKHDRLSRVQASVSLAAGEAQSVFTAACAGWLKNAAPASAGAASQAAACEGREGEIRFSGRLEVAPDQAELSMVLDSVPDP